MNQNGRINFTAGLDTSELENDIRRAQDSFSELNGHVKDECSDIDGAIKGIGAAIGAVFTVQKAGEFIKQMVAVRGEIESLEKSFDILAGTVEGGKLFEEIRTFAVSTPMTMPALAKGAQTLLAFNIEAGKVMPILKAIGDISMGNEQKFNSLVLAFSQMSSTGKLMGQDLLQMINAGFNPLAVISEQTGKSIGVLKEEMSAGAISSDMITQAFMDATSEGGKFHNMLEIQSKGIEGSLSNLEGAIQDMFNDLGQKSQSAITGSILGATRLVQNYEKVGRTIAELIAVYGTYKAALITLNIIKKTSISLTAGWTAAELLHYNALLLVEKAQKLLNATMLKNPYVLAAAAVAALGYGLYKMISYQTDAERAQKKLNETTEEFNKEVASERVQIDSLFARLKAAKEGTEEYENVKKAIISQYGNYLDGLSDEIRSLQDVEGAYKAVAEAAKDAAKARALEKITKDAADTYAAKEADVKKEVKELLDEKFKGQYSPDGMSLSETYYWKITPVLEGTEEITDEIQNIISQFDATSYYSTSSGMVSYQYNNLMAQITAAEEARKLYDKTISEGDMIYGVSSRTERTNTAETPEPVDMPIYGVDYENAKEAWEKAKQELQKIEKDKENFTTKQYEEAKSEEEKARKAYQSLGGNIRKSASKDESADIEEREKNASRERQALEKELYFQEQQNIINLETNERIRKERQMELDHERELYLLEQQKQSSIADEIERQREIFEAKEKAKSSADEDYTPQTFTEDDIDSSFINAIGAEYDKVQSYILQRQQQQRQQATEEQAKEDEKAMNEYLQEYGSYMEKRQAIIQLYNSQMTEAESEGERLTLAGKMREELSELDVEANKATAAISQLFGDMTNKTVSDMYRIADAAQGALNFLIAGEWDEIKGIEFGMTKETFETLKSSPEELEKIRQAIEDVRMEAEQSEGSFKKMTNGLKELFSAGDDSKKMKKALSDIQSGFGEVMQLAGFLSDTFSSLGEAFGNETLTNIAEGINVAMDAANSTMAGIQAGAMFGPLGAAIGGTIGLVSSLAKSFSKLHDEKVQKNIDALIDRYEELNNSLEDYGRLAEETFGAGKQAAIEQQIELKKMQIELLKLAIAEEQTKKNPDDSAIDEWNNQINSLENEIDDLGEAAEDAIFGESLQTAIENFANALTDAWSSGMSMSETANKFMREMIKKTVMQAILDYTQASKKIEALRFLIGLLLSDGVISEEEQAYLEEIAQNLMNEVEDQFAWAEGLFSEDFSQDSTKKGFQAMSQDMGEELNGRFTAIQIDASAIRSFVDSIFTTTTMILGSVVDIRQAVNENRNLALSALDHLETISKNTNELYEINERLGKIEQNTRNL